MLVRFYFWVINMQRGKGLLQDEQKAMELWKQAPELGYSLAHFQLSVYYRGRGDSKKTKSHYKAAAMVGQENARCNLGTVEAKLGNLDRAIKHWTITASAGTVLPGCMS